MGLINLYPTICNICGGQVVFTSNAAVYGKEYGSGKCYLCQSCGAYTGTHRPRPKEALGLLADEPMRKGKVACHDLFDAMWKGKRKAQKKRKDLYSWLADRMGISVEECHFGYFNIHQLRSAYKILRVVHGQELRYDNKGRIYFDRERKDNGQA
jgi:hypothetical protein